MKHLYRVSLKKSYLVVLFLLSSAYLRSQSAIPIFHNSSFNISQHSISAIAQDEMGFLWIGTRYGLHRFNGISYTSYNITKPNSKILKNNIINTICIDAKGDIWVGTNGGGLALYSYEQDAFVNIPLQNEEACTLEASIVHDIHEDKNKNLWVGTNDGLYVLKAENQCFTRFQHQVKDPKTLSSSNIASIGEDAEGNIWIGTWSNGLNLYQPNTNNFIRFTTSNTVGLTNNNIRCLHLTENGQFLIGTGLGAKQIVYTLSGYEFRPLVNVENGDNFNLNQKRILSIESHIDGKIWLGTENEGLYLVEPKKSKVQQFKNDPNRAHSLCSNSIWSLMYDKDNILWIGTFNQGLCKIDRYETKFDNLYRSSLRSESLNNNVISSFSEDAQGNIWVGTEGGGLNYLNRNNNHFTHFTHNPTNPNSLSNNNVVCLLTDSKNRLWVGTWEGGLNLTENGKDFKHFTTDVNNPKTISNNDIYALLEDRKGNIWISCFRTGLDVYNPTTKTFTHFSPDADSAHNITSYRVRSLWQDSAGVIWLGTEGDGILKLYVDDSLNIINRQVYNTKNSKIPSDDITQIFEDTKGNMWFGTEGAGLSKLTQKGFVNVSKRTGLSGNIVNAIEQSSDTALWISTNQGLSLYNPISGKAINFTASDGLQSNEFYRSASLKTRSGHLLFGGINGFNLFHPDSVNLNPLAPEVYVSGFSLSQNAEQETDDFKLKKNILFTDVIDLSYDQNNFQIKLSAISFSQSSKNKYAYKLDGFDKTWRYTNNPNNVYYTNVPPGNYELLIKAANNDGLWSKAYRPLEINIASPWYSTTLAYILYGLILAALLYWSRRNLIKNERLRGQVQLDHIQLKQARELSEIRSKFFTNITHEFRTPLTLIIAPLKNLIKLKDNENSKQYGVMLNNAQRLLNLINQILDLSKVENGQLKLKAWENDLAEFTKQIAASFSMYADKKMINYSIDVPNKSLAVYFDRDKLEKILTNILSNALKFTSNYGKVSVSLTSTNTHAIISISDSAHGIPKEELELIFQRYYQLRETGKNMGTGIGLALTKELVDLHKGEINVESELGKGSTFTVQLRLGKEHLSEDEISAPTVDWRLNEDNLSDIPFEAQENNEDFSANHESEESALILVAEDNTEIREFIAQLLEKEYQVITCKNGAEAQEKAIQQIPDLIISDIMMPEIDGYELCTLLKNNENTSHIPVMLLTAKASNASEAQGLQLGAIYYLTKPFDPELLLLRIRNILDNLKLQKQQVLENRSISLEPSPVPMSNADEAFIKKILELVEENMSNSEFQVTDLSHKLNMSKMQLYRKMKGLIGTSANEFIRTIRLKKAAMLLKQGDLSVAEVTYTVGFNDLQYFRNCFKKQYGYNPSDYQNKQGKA